MIQIIKNGDPDKKCREQNLLFDNKVTCPLCNCEFQFDSEDLKDLKMISQTGIPNYYVNCPWCAKVGVAPNKIETIWRE